MSLRTLAASLLLLLLHAATASAAVRADEAPRDLAFWPGDVSGVSEGALAVPVDPAAAGFVNGAELTLRRGGSPGSRGFGALGLHAAAPWGPLTLHGGWAFAQVPSPRARAANVGLSVQLAPGLRLGASLQRLQAPGTNRSQSVYDLGLALRPHPVVSLSLGGEALNAPRWRRERWTVHRGLRLGLGLRPFAGSPRLTVGADARLVVTAAGWLPDVRAVIDAAPWDAGVHAFVAWQRGPVGQALWVGLRFDTFAGGLMGAGRADPSPRAGHRADRMALVARWQAHPDAQALQRPRPRLEVDVAGDLATGQAGLWQRGEAVSTLAARLQALVHSAPDLREVLLNVDALQVNLASIDELRAAIYALRHAGKKVVARLVNGGSKEYLVAIAADRVELDPLGSLDLSGFVRRRHYFANALARIGVRFEAVGIGRYKSGPDDLVRAAPRDEDGEVQQSLVDTAYATLLQALQQDRQLTAAAAHAALAEGLVDASQAHALGLVDALSPRVSAALGQTQSAVHGAPLAAMDRPTAVWGPVKKVVVVPIVGVMVEGDAAWSSEQGSLGLGTGPSSNAYAVADQLERAQRDPQVAGIVVRIDSPGGDVYAAERVWRAVREAARHKPVVASLGDVAASGGYYAAVAAPTIFAQRNTVTGSIGIYRLKPDISHLLELLGVHRAGRSQGEHAGWDDLEAPWSQADRARLCRNLQSYYGAFVDRVAAGRRLTAARAEELAQGRVYAGAEALQNGLVDYSGGLAEAIAWVREQANLAADEELELQVPRRHAGPTALLRHLLSATTSPVQAPSLGHLAARTQQQLHAVAETTWALWPPAQ